MNTFFKFQRKNKELCIKLRHLHMEVELDGWLKHLIHKRKFR